MLVLSRKKGDRVFLEWGGQRIEVAVVRCNEAGVRLGFVAPPDVNIVREELLIQEDGEHAAIQPAN